MTLHKKFEQGSKWSNVKPCPSSSISGLYVIPFSVIHKETKHSLLKDSKGCWPNVERSNAALLSGVDVSGLPVF